MKKILLAICLLICTCLAFGQAGSPTFNRYISEVTAINKQTYELIAQKQYKQSEEALHKALSMTAELKLNEEEEATYGRSVKWIKAQFHYNLACVYALQGKKKRAIKEFESAIDNGFEDYRHAQSDEDLAAIRKDKRFVSLLERIRQFDKLYILQNSPAYQKEMRDSLPEFRYQSKGNSNLMLLRSFFNLDSIAGSGDELSKIMKLLYFVHNTIRHDGSNYALCEYDAIDIYNYHKSTGKGVNCRHLAIALNEMYLSLGIPSRYVTCMPKATDDGDCHVINAVYSSQLQKWIWIDPTFNAYVKDELGNLLSIAEVRQRLIEGKALHLNEDANWNNETKQTVEHYLETYMAKNLYWFDCVQNSCFNPESRYRNTENRSVSLKPVGYGDETESSNTSRTFVTNDAEYFWQKPQSPN